MIESIPSQPTTIFELVAFLAAYSVRTLLLVIVAFQAFFIWKLLTHQTTTLANVVKEIAAVMAVQTAAITAIDASVQRMIRSQDEDRADARFARRKAELVKVE